MPCGVCVQVFDEPTPRASQMVSEFDHRMHGGGSAEAVEVMARSAKTTKRERD